MFVLHFFLMTSYPILAATLQIARVSPSPLGDASHMFRHDSYVDKKVRQVAVNILNHQDYHQRNVIFPSSTSIFPSFVSNLTTATSLLLDAGIQLQPTSTTLSFTASNSFGSTVVSPSAPHSLSFIRPIFNSTNISAINSTFAPSMTCHGAVTKTITGANRTITVYPTGSAFTASSFPSFTTNATDGRAKGSAFTPSVYSSYGNLNMTGDGSTRRTYTASSYNSSVATGIGPLVPAPVASSYLSRYAVADSLQLTGNLSLKAEAGISWDKATDNACYSQLSTLNGIGTSPSGISPCYNVRTLDSSSGAFNAELRLYRIAAASGDWTKLRSDGVIVGLAYPAATVNLQWIVRKRSLVDSRGSMVNPFISQISPRASDTAPKLLQELSFLGQVHNNSVPELSIQANALALLTPKINLAGSTGSGAPLSTQLSLQDASFVNGIFAANLSSNAIGPAIMVVGSRDWLIEANSFSGFPLSLLLVAVLSASLFAIKGYDLMEKLKCRNEDRKRILAGSSGGGVEM